MPELQKNFQRQVAYKLRISDILSGAFIKDGSSAGYIMLNDAKASRANVIATVVYKSESHNFANAIIDDGTGKISLRAFERLDFFSKVDVGDTVMVVGRSGNSTMKDTFFRKLRESWATASGLT